MRNPTLAKWACQNLYHLIFLFPHISFTSTYLLNWRLITFNKFNKFKIFTLKKIKKKKWDANAIEQGALCLCVCESMIKYLRKALFILGVWSWILFCGYNNLKKNKIVFSSLLDLFKSKFNLIIIVTSFRIPKMPSRNITWNCKFDCNCEIGHLNRRAF